MKKTPEIKFDSRYIEPNQNIYNLFDLNVNINVPRLLYQRVNRILIPDKNKIITGGSYTIAHNTPHFAVRQYLFENNIWPYNDHLDDSHNLLIKHNTFVHSRFNLNLRMSLDDLTTVFLVSKDQTPYAKFIFNDGFIHLIELNFKIE